MCDQLIDIYQTTCPEYYKWISLSCIGIFQKLEYLIDII